MKAIVKFFAKKYIASIVTDMLQQASKKIDLETWKSRVRTVLQFCQFLLDRLDDNVITEEEAEQIADAAAKLVR